MRLPVTRKLPVTTMPSSMASRLDAIGDALGADRRDRVGLDLPTDCTAANWIAPDDAHQRLPRAAHREQRAEIAAEFLFAGEAGQGRADEPGELRLGRFQLPGRRRSSPGPTDCPTAGPASDSAAAMLKTLRQKPMAFLPASPEQTIGKGRENPRRPGGGAQRCARVAAMSRRRSSRIPPPASCPSTSSDPVSAKTRPSVKIGRELPYQSMQETSHS